MDKVTIRAKCLEKQQLLLLHHGVVVHSLSRVDFLLKKFLADVCEPHAKRSLTGVSRRHLATPTRPVPNIPPGGNSIPSHFFPLSG